ncbi:23S rRNA (guanosine-2'-O-)-methyltransferase RlmB [Massilia sp. Bi118]|uniref:TrmH family RNA methyltransferase n=1 Tax=Massilia sp. Bi118 TaxID=2822346 RepID=UPI001D5A744E|nr:RNA methyltransferase [Massilia sp. Bi118]CAH0169956.1 23S rRNA (guanosine-2'-O-)-methyltransferase RlmB [Massilia sp. Bi118]
MKTVSSRDNPFYKELKALATSSQARRKAGRSLLDGVHLCQSWLDLRGLPVHCVVSEDALANPEVASIVGLVEAGRGHVTALPEALFGAISQVEHGVNIVFVVDTPAPVVPKLLTESAVLLDGVQDPGNVGSILRSAGAAGIRQVWCSPGTAFCWSPKVLRAAMGAHFVLEIFENADLAGLVRNAKVPVLATSGYAAECLYDIELSGPAAWVLGHEGQGVSDQLLNLASRRVAVPHAGQVESLNVAACAAVCFFEQLRQTRRRQP